MPVNKLNFEQAAQDTLYASAFEAARVGHTAMQAIAGTAPVVSNGNKFRPIF